jgi:hypothetical protein
MAPMSDHAILGLLLVVELIVGLVGVTILVRMLRESQRMTRAVAGLVYQESDKLRALFTDR